MIRPYGIVINGSLELGLELVLAGGVIRQIRPHTRPPEDFVVSAAFVNAHSHLEYRGMHGQITGLPYWPWIRELTRIKEIESAEDVAAACLLAAKENIATGIGWIGEHSDRVGSAMAMKQAGLRGVIFQELIALTNDQEEIDATWQSVSDRAILNGLLADQVFVSPHAYQTVHFSLLERIAKNGRPFSIHVAETPMESELTRAGTGSLAEFRARFGMDISPKGKSVVAALNALDLVRPGAQFVHVCAVSAEDIELMATNKVTVAHCPRSNRVLGCPDAPIREILDAGIRVGLGLDSAASSGPIDMFAEMQAALMISRERGRPISAEETWRSATSMGYQSFGNPVGTWDVQEGNNTPMIKLHIAAARTTDDLIEAGSPSVVQWI